MTTDITVLTQSLKAAAEKATPGEWVLQLCDEIYATNDGVNYEQVAIATLDARDADYIALANPANVKQLVEALEKAQTINAAAEKLVRCKGRYHSELNYRALAALFGVKTPDLPPMENENVHYADAAEMEIAALRQRIAELESFRSAYMVWSDKTDWVRDNRRFDVVKPLGKHLADVLKEYIEHLECRATELEESNAQVIQSRDHYKRMTEEGLKQLAESRTVTVKLPADNAAESESPENDVSAWFDEGWNARGKADKEALTAAGIKWG